MTDETLDGYVERFEQMVAEMREHPRIAVTHFKISDPVSDDEIAMAEEKLGVELDDAIKTFYRQADGIQLRWKDRQGDHYVEGDDDTTITEFTPDLCGGNDDAAGVVDIWPLTEVFVYNYYIQDLTFEWMADNTTEFDGEEYNMKAFFESVYPFDRYSFYRSTAFWAGKENPGSTVIMGDDHDASFTSSRITDFRSYLEFILAHRGSHEARRKQFIKFKGHQLEPLEFSADDFPSSPLPIEEVLASC